MSIRLQDLLIYNTDEETWVREGGGTDNTPVVLVPFSFTSESKIVIATNIIVGDEFSPTMTLCNQTDIIPFDNSYTNVEPLTTPGCYITTLSEDELLIGASILSYTYNPELENAETYIKTQIIALHPTERFNYSYKFGVE